MRQTLKTAFLSTIPVLTGYLALGFGFGILLTANGFGILLAFFMSLFIGIIVYILMLIFTKCISEKDFALLKERN